HTTARRHLHSFPTRRSSDLAGLEHLEGAPGGRTGDVLDVALVVQLEADGAAGTLVAGLHAGVAHGHALDHEARAHLVVLDEDARSEERRVGKEWRCRVEP